MRLFVFSLFLLVFKSGAAEATQPPLSEHPRIKDAIGLVDAWIDSLLDYGQVPGISVGFVVDQELVFAKGYGYSNLENKIRTETDTIYSVCSISKLFTSIGIMQLRDSGVLTLRDPIERHLKWFAIESGHLGSGPVRVGGLLTHSSGLPRESDFPYWTRLDFPFPEQEQMKEQLKEQTTIYPAETRFQYSNLGFALAGAILADTSGLTYQQYMEQKVIGPMGLQDTRTYFPTKLHGDQMATGYAGLRRDRVRKELPPFDTGAITPAAGFTSTVEDLSRFASWNFRTLSGQDDTVLEGNTLREMQRVNWVDPDWKSSWGLGFSVSQEQGETVVSHGGACPGYITHFAMLPKFKLAAIALTNSADGPASLITTSLIKVVGSALRSLDTPVESPVNLDLSIFAGNYSTNVWGGEIALRVSGNELAVILLGNPRVPMGEIQKLRYLEANTFVRVEDNEPREFWHFELDESGRAVQFKRHQGLYSRID
mgnify:FL=1